MKMSIRIVGGGPSGLYFAYLMKKSFPSCRIVVVEQNPRDATYGFGVVFSGDSLNILSGVDPIVTDELRSHVEMWNEQYIVHRGERVVIDGSGFSGIRRLVLLQLLQQLCEEQGVEIRFNQRVDNGMADDCDVLVAADGANSVIRDSHPDAFQTEVIDLENYFAWYGVNYPYDAHTITFVTNGTGVFCGHHYRYTPNHSTFVAEVDAETWHRSGMDAMDDAQRQHLAEEVFADTLHGNPLISNRSLWHRYRIVKNKRWYHGNIVLIGDAQRTAHPSIGSGTRLAMKDAVSLWEAFQSDGDDLQSVFASYERNRRPDRNRLDGAAENSIAWYEAMGSKMHMEPVELAYDYVMRTGVMTPERMWRNSPGFMRRYESRRS